jgi:hypothetical protein
LIHLKAFLSSWITSFWRAYIRRIARNLDAYLDKVEAEASVARDGGLSDQD